MSSQSALGLRGLAQAMKRPVELAFSMTPSIDPSAVSTITGHLRSARGRRSSSLLGAIPRFLGLAVSVRLKVPHPRLNESQATVPLRSGESCQCGHVGYSEDFYLFGPNLPQIRHHRLTSPRRA